MPQGSLYPEIKPFDTCAVPVDDRHRLHVERYGNANGFPVILLHGGPGASWSPHMIRFFDPDRYHIIAFDQRGAWRSTPLGELTDNSTHHTIGDIETIRRLFGVESWLVFGCSWGSALSVAYAEHHTSRCAALVVQGVTMFRPGFEQWDFYTSRDLYPDAFRKLQDFAPPGKRDALFDWYADTILGDDAGRALAAANAWYDYSTVLSNARHVDPALEGPAETDDLVLAGARISMHYWRNDAFLATDSLIGNAGRLKGIPGAILHGEKDFNCSLDDARSLHREWPDARLHVIPDAGHSAFEPETARLLKMEMDRLAGR
ncbi:MAG: alpha/beta fold hydrolase [Alphaproteobacteria bacterium]